MNQPTTVVSESVNKDARYGCTLNQPQGTLVRYQNNFKNKSIQATEEDLFLRKEASKDTASSFRPKIKSIQGVQSTCRIESKDKSI